MPTLDTHQLLHAIESSATSAEQRLLSLFDVLENLSGADSTSVKEDAAPLLHYLTQQARLAHAHLPETLARQLWLMALDAQQSPGNDAMKHAKQAARALIQAQTEARFNYKPPLYAMAASLFVMLVAGNLLLDESRGAGPAPAAADAPGRQAAPAMPDSSPTRIADMLLSREQMRQGTCQFPEALMLAEQDRGIYLTNVVHGEISHNRNEQEAVNRLMAIVRCDYTPMLMKNSVS